MLLKEKIEKMVNVNLANCEFITISAPSVYRGTVTHGKKDNWTADFAELGTTQLFKDSYELAEWLLTDVESDTITYTHKPEEKACESKPESVSCEENFFKKQDSLESTLTFYNVDWKKGDIDICNVNVALKNVKNLKYFSRAITFHMFRTLERIGCEKSASVKKSLHNLEIPVFADTVDYQEYLRKKESLEDSLKKVESILSTLKGMEKKVNFKEFEVNLFNSDNYAKIVGVALFADNAKELADVMTMYNSEKIISTLATYVASVNKGGKEEQLKPLRKECIHTIENIWKHYLTENSAFYSALNLHCNRASFEKVYKVSYTQIQKNRTTKLYDSKENVRKYANKIQFEIIGLLIEKIQKNLDLL